MSVVEHSAVDDAWMVLGKVLEILIVGGDDAKSLLLPELFEHGLGNGSTDGRLRTAAKLVDEQ